MSQPNRCPQCGAELPSGALGGLCPKCLLAAGLESRAEAENAAGSGSQAPTTPHSGGFTPPDAASLAAHFPQLEILELLGHGGMGAVYKARQPKLDRLVALKIIRPESADDPAFAERFNREARMLARLSHPRIVAVYDFGEVSVPEVAAGSGPRTLYFFLMEYVEGTNLRQLLQAGELLPQQALAIVPQICEALQFAHDEGIVHRDIKPENILLDKRGRVKIADFGLAKLAAGSREEFTLTGTHQVMGTPRYMAPEQMEGSHAVDHRADIYSLGVVFYEMLTGEVPMGHFDPPSQKVEVDVRLDSVILRTLARQPERRYQHASEVKTDVESISRRTSNPPMTAAGARAEMDEGAPRLSRKAVLGAWAVALSVAAAITVFVAGTGLMALHEEQGPVVLQWWEYPILLTLGLAFLIGLIAPFAATILGIVAINEIRHSQGRLVGLGLAFFDAAFFPVVLVEGVIFFVCWALWAYVWWEIIGRPNYDGGFFPFWLLSSLLLSVPIAVLIRSWWRTAVGYTIDDVSLRRRIGNTDTAPRHEVAVRKPKRRYQHASDVKTDVDSILETSNRIIPAEAPKPASTYWKPSWTVYAAYSLVLALMLHAFLAALYGGDDFWNKGVAVAACLAIVGCSCLAYLVEKLGFDSRRPLSYARNLMSLVFGLVLLLIPTMVLSPVELNDWVPSAAKSLTPRDERYLRLLQLGMFLWTFYFVGVHVLNGLGRSILHKDRLPIGGEPEGEPASKVPRAKPDNEVARLVINPAWGLIITAVISWVT
ncbi:MAG TPA: protein kinase, partial [Lacipirellulaceae bacterium]|nr:protein kinase [Lacipirellulaceae bacterium]